jgi:inner membrane protein
MDPVSQATLAASASQSFAYKDEMKWAMLIGALSGMAPDLDSFIRSSSDPLVYFEYHRHFTHSLVFIPFGALVVSLLLHLILKNKISFSKNYFYSILGYATHGLLDSCTSYGTHLFWPFSDYRVAWNNVSIVDPLFTLPLIVFCILALKRKSKSYSRAGLLYAFFYLLLGFVQNHRAAEIGKQIAIKRGHDSRMLVVKPSFGNLILWRSIYEYKGYFYTDAVRVGLSNKVFKGQKIKKFAIKEDFPWIRKGSQHFIDIKKFKWYSNDYLALHPENPHVIGDIRHSMSPDSIYPLWGLKVMEGKDHMHLKRMNFRSGSLKHRSRFLQMLFWHI